MIAINPVKATRREWIGLSILILPILLVSMDMTVTYLALPVLSVALKPTSAELLWITDIFSFMEAGLLIVMGSLGDRVGLKKILLWGASAFAAASVFAAFAPSAFWLIVARAIMGVAGATLLPNVLSLVRNMFVNGRERTFAMGLYTTCFSTGIMLGPIIGGFLLGHFWWGSIFLIPAPLLLILLFAAPVLLPEFKDAQAKALDFISSVLLIAATLLVIYGVKQIAQNGLSAEAGLSIVAGLVLAVLFVRRQGLLMHPLIDIKLFALPGFSVALAALFTALLSWAGMFLFVGQYLQSVLGLSSFAAGFWMLPGAAGSVGLCMLAPVAVRYFSRGKVMAAGLIVMAVGTGLLALLTVNSLLLLIVAIFLMSGGSGLTVTLGIDMVVSSAPANKAGAAAGISETSTTFGAAFGVAIYGSIWTALYRGDLARNMPASLPVGDAAIARSTIGGAVVTAGKLHDFSLLTLAREAFVNSLHITAAICAVIILAIAVLVVVKFNGKGSSLAES